eukprot:798679-Rhodomonas_salina.1
MAGAREGGGSTWTRRAHRPRRPRAPSPAAPAAPSPPPPLPPACGDPCAVSCMRARSVGGRCCALCVYGG